MRNLDITKEDAQGKRSMEGYYQWEEEVTMFWLKKGSNLEV